MAYPDITVDDTGSRTQCIHYASSLHGKLGDEMEGRFNQDLPESLQAAFKKAMNFEPHILTKQTINTRRMNEVNQIAVTQYDEEFEVNEAHIQNPNYKGKNYDPNYQNKNKNNNYDNETATWPHVYRMGPSSSFFENFMKKLDSGWRFENKYLGFPYLSL